MKKLLLSVIAVFTIVNWSPAQCPMGNLTLTTQAQIDAFPFDYPGCAELTGGLNITGVDITDLSGLSGITGIASSLSIYECNNLLTLNGLNSLQHIGYTLDIENNELLTTLSGLESLITIGHDLEIFNNPDLASITALSNLESVEHSVIVHEDHALVNLEGLENIDSTSEAVSIYECDGLTSLAGLDNLVYTRIVYLSNLPALSNLDALSNLTTVVGFQLQNLGEITTLDPMQSLSHVSGHLVIGDCNKLLNLAGLENITAVGGNLSISSNPKLNSLTGLDNLVFVGNDLKIYHNDSLTDILPLSSVGFVGTDLNIAANHGLETLDGLENILTVGNDLIISANYALTDISALENLIFVGNKIVITQNTILSDLSPLNNINNFIGDLGIADNPALSDCTVVPFCNTIGYGEAEIGFYNNALGCNTVQEVGESCHLSHVSGFVFIDLDCNNAFDGDDAALSEQMLRRVDNSMPFAFTDVDGNYLRFLLPSTSFEYAPDTYPGYSVLPASLTVENGLGEQNFSNYDFRLCPDSLFHNLSVNCISADPPQPGFSGYYSICVENTGTYLENALLTFDFSTPPADVYLLITNPDGGVVDGTTITWALDDIPLFTPVCFDIQFEVSADAVLGSSLAPLVTVTSTEGITETTLEDNSFVLDETLIGSLDPNDKTVDQPEVDFTNSANGTRLQYLIRFQNTGTAPATFVEVLDMLEDKLDPTSFQMIAASHPYTLSFPADRVLKWRFDNINLPDSTSNEFESHGFISFSIKTVPGLSLTDVVSNTASIYFDYNAPVITNTATTSFVVGVREIPQHNTLKIAAFPNPTDGIIRLVFTMQEASECRIEISNFQGCVLKYFELGFQTAEEHSFPLDLSDLASGLYQVRVIADRETGFVKLVSTE